MDVQTDDMCEDTETVRNGYRDRSLTTSAGAISLRIPKLRAGTYFPEQIVDHYSRTDKAVVAAVREMCVNGVSTRKVERVASTSGRFRRPNRPETPQHADVSPGRRSRQRTTPPPKTAQKSGTHGEIGVQFLRNRPEPAGECARRRSRGNRKRRRGRNPKHRGGAAADKAAAADAHTGMHIGQICAVTKQMPAPDAPQTIV